MMDNFFEIIVKPGPGKGLIAMDGCFRYASVSLRKQGDVLFASLSVIWYNNRKSESVVTHGKTSKAAM
jgi:hypothetical protein